MKNSELKYDMKLLQERFNNFKKEVQEEENKKNKKKDSKNEF